MKDFIYLRSLRYVNHSVFSVAQGQKTYTDPEFNVDLPFSSGQQVKRSILDQLVHNMGEKRAPVVFQWRLVDKKNATAPKEDIAVQMLDPRNIDELLGGYMRAEAKGTKKGEDEALGVIKRRSPLSISAMTPLHPLLGHAEVEQAITFDRNDDGNSYVVLIDTEGNRMPEEEMKKYLETNQLTLRKSKYVDARNQRRAYGIFCYNIAIDLRRLFTVSTDPTAPEAEPKILRALRSEGWEESSNVFGPCLTLPKNKRDEIIPHLASALIEWQISSNQSRTYSPMELLAIAISDNANTMAASIRAKLNYNEDGRLVARPFIDGDVGANVYTYVTAESHIPQIESSKTAINDAKNELERRLKDYSYM